MRRNPKGSARSLHVISGGVHGSNYRDAMQGAQRAYLTDLLRRHGGVVSAAAEEAGMGRNTLYTLMVRVGIDWHNLPPEPRKRPVYLREAPHCPTCACGLTPHDARREAVSADHG